MRQKEQNLGSGVYMKVSSSNEISNLGRHARISGFEAWELISRVVSENVGDCP